MGGTEDEMVGVDMATVDDRPTEIYYYPTGQQFKKIITPWQSIALFRGRQVELLDVRNDRHRVHIHCFRGILPLHHVVRS